MTAAISLLFPIKTILEANIFVHSTYKASSPTTPESVISGQVYQAMTLPLMSRRYGVNYPVFEAQRGQDMFLSFKSTRPKLRPTQLPTEREWASYPS
jgi:hypothetical protein